MSINPVTGQFQMTGPPVAGFEQARMNPVQLWPEQHPAPFSPQAIAKVTPVPPSTVRLRPPPLQQGDTIALIAPGGQVDKAKLQVGATWLRHYGFNPVVSPNATHYDPYFPYLSGTVKERLNDFYQALADPKVKALMFIRGGYGSARLLSQINWDWVRQQVTRQPKTIVGFSDTSALLNTIEQQTGLVTFHGPMLEYNFTVPNRYTVTQLFNMTTNPAQRFIATHPGSGYYCFNGGYTNGRLVGGNLTTLASLCGTPWQPNTDDAILFLEDVGPEVDDLYRLDRLWTQLKLSGMFNNIRGLVLGQFKLDEKDNRPWNRANLQQVLYNLCRETFGDRIPIGYNFSLGHGVLNTTMPIGPVAEFDANKGQLRLLEPVLAGSSPR
ncbi:MAG: LD-carboxypeptidase [Cyanobacteria bacterium HKST-UBA04]|nr:LD-carboxypeptidase [Cyanobacteria bacterium HKST-UBA04]